MLLDAEVIFHNVFIPDPVTIAAIPIAAGFIDPGFEVMERIFKTELYIKKGEIEGVFLDIILITNVSNGIFNRIMDRRFICND